MIQAPEASASTYPYFEEPNPGILRLVGSGLRILDVGCGYGALGEALRQRGNSVVGVDIEETAIRKAVQRLDEAHVFDVLSEAPAPFGEETRFNLIIFADILEHLADPIPILQRFAKYLSPGGRVLISLPNVVAWPIRLSVLFGRFEYTDSGTLDRGHLRFYTRRTAHKMIEAAGFKIVKTRVTPSFVRALLPLVRKWYLGEQDAPGDPQAIVRSAPYRFYIRWGYPMEAAVARLWGGLFAFQFIFTAEVDSREKPA